MADLLPTWSDLSPTPQSAATVSDWYTSEQIQEVPDTVAPYLAAHGFIVDSGRAYLIEGEFGGWALNMHRQSFDHDEAIQDLLNRQNDAYNEGRAKNDLRYEDLMRNFGDVLSKAQAHLSADKTTLDNEISLHLVKLSTLDTDYEEFFVDVKADLDGLTVTMEADRTRVNLAFDAQLSQSDQQLMNKGFYSSAMTTMLDAGIEVKRQIALTEVSEKEQRLIAEITMQKNSIYKGVLEMRQGLIAAQMGIEGKAHEFLAYDLDTKNNIAFAMFKMAESREDSHPGLGDEAALVTSLGDDT